MMLRNKKLLKRRGSGSADAGEGYAEDSVEAGYGYDEAAGGER